MNFHYRFIILGNKFFAYKVYLDWEGRLTTAVLGKLLVNNFNSAYDAFVNVFAVTIGEDWNQIMYNYLIIVLFHYLFVNYLSQLTELRHLTFYMFVNVLYSN